MQSLKSLRLNKARDAAVNICTNLSFPLWNTKDYNPQNAINKTQ